MSWFVYEVPEYHEDAARIEPLSELRSRVLKVNGPAMADELESVRENAAAAADTPSARCVRRKIRMFSRFLTPIP